MPLKNSIYYFFDKHHIYLDTRVMERLVAQRRLSNDVVTKYLTNLPDISDQLEQPQEELDKDSNTLSFTDQYKPTPDDTL